MVGRTILVKVDECLLAEAKEVLGATSIVDTVNQALNEAVTLRVSRRLSEMERAISESIEDPEEERRRAWGRTLSISSTTA